MDFFGLLQLNSIQIGQNKYFTFLAHNEELTQLDGIIRWNIEDLSTDPRQKEEKIFKFDLFLNHKSDRNDPSPKHRWEFLSKVSTFKNSDSKKVIASLGRKELGGAKWKVCLLFLRSLTRKLITNRYFLVLYHKHDGVFCIFTITVYHQYSK